MKKYQVHYYWTIEVEAQNENEAQETADEIAKWDILSIDDLSCEIEEVKRR